MANTRVMEQSEGGKVVAVDPAVVTAGTWPLCFMLRTIFIH